AGRYIRADLRAKALEAFPASARVQNRDSLGRRLGDRRAAPLAIRTTGPRAHSMRALDGMDCVLVSHFHWDREWYRQFEAYRARLVDAVDRVLDLLAVDAGYHFLLDGQTVLLEDYLAIRPERRA